MFLPSFNAPLTPTSQSIGPLITEIRTMRRQMVVIPVEFVSFLPCGLKWSPWVGVLERIPTRKRNFHSGNRFLRRGVGLRTPHKFLSLCYCPDDDSKRQTSFTCKSGTGGLDEQKQRCLVTSRTVPKVPRRRKRRKTRHDNPFTRECHGGPLGEPDVWRRDSRTGSDGS